MANKWTDPTGQITAWEEKTLRGDVTYYLETPAGKKAYSSRSAWQAAYKKLIEPNKKEIFNPKTGTYKKIKPGDVKAYETAQKAGKATESEKKMQSQLKLGGYFKDPSTGVDTIDSLRAQGDFTPERFKKAKTPEQLERQKGVLEKSLERLTDKKTDAETGDYSDIVWTEQDQRDYDYYNRRLDEVRKGLGTHSPKAPKPGGDSGPGEPKEKKMGYWDRAEKETWIKTRANEILAEGKLMFNQARKQAEEDWEKEHNKKDPARLFE